MALLVALSALRPLLHIELHVLHCDHGLREESSKEASWVSERCAALRLECQVSATEQLKSLQSGVQAAARAWRLAEAEALLAATQSDWIATGHQRDDDLETFFMKLIRGCHLSRLQGLSARKGPLIRPLLPFSHHDLQAYLLDKGQDWLEDPSNLSLKSTRNRLRHGAMPVLHEMGGGALAERLWAMTKQARELEEWLAGLPPPPQSALESAFHWISVDGLLGMPGPARTYAVDSFVRHRNLRKR